MASAAAYDSWDDPGLAFSEDEVAGWDMQKWAEERIALLHVHFLTALRKSELPGVEKPDWWRKAADKVLDLMTWYCVALEIPGFDREAIRKLPDPSSSAGKELTKKALDCDPKDWLGMWADGAESAMRYVVTIGRRKAGKGCTKVEKKRSNKLANCVFKEINGNQRLETMLESRTA